MSDITKEEREKLRVEFEPLIKARPSVGSFNRKYSDYCTNDGPEWFYENEVLNAAFEGFILGRQSSSEKVDNESTSDEVTAARAKKLIAEMGIDLSDNVHQQLADKYIPINPYNDRCVNHEDN